jgi:hypothetical protein
VFFQAACRLFAHLNGRSIPDDEIQRIPLSVISLVPPRR